MSFSLYSATVPSFLQVLGSVAVILEKAEAHCKEKGVAPDDLLNARLAEDMWPLAVQVKQTVAHSALAIEAVQKGVFSPDRSPMDFTFASLRALIDGARQKLQKIDRTVVDGVTGRDMRFEVGEVRLDFTAEDFLMSFSIPNFYFHATTAYDILRMNGLPVGKRDYLGAMRLKR